MKMAAFTNAATGKELFRNVASGLIATSIHAARKYIISTLGKRRTSLISCEWYLLKTRIFICPKQLPIYELIFDGAVMGARNF
ncbi:hypothetical protein Agabi119p4_7636 [Agaricus bisporus var. burnettii]|uniref:Uncharacterized protein n=1 Tax=Agaricus bisporus var. burnettii TaxID=192524 RepID=A0A8H7EZ44_AGABI|nr:hypothetical protein Agabi119p4_7636 [Agaricus bisporus var. burnettii]